MVELACVIYVSSAALEIAEKETLHFLNAARKAHRKNDLSGMMLYINGYFLHLLEGHPIKVTNVCQTIFHDKRAMRIVHREAIPERLFPEWTVEFEAIAAYKAGQIIGDSSIFDSVADVARIQSTDVKTLFSIVGRRRYQSERSGIFRAIRLTSDSPGR